MAKTKKATDGGPVTIKKYANRRLYNTGTSSYITLDTLATMTREDVDFVVVDAKSGDDITHNVLTQIIMDEESGTRRMLPVGFLRQIISMYGNSMQALMPSYLEASMESFRKNQRHFQDAVENALNSNPIGQMAIRNQKQFSETVEKALKATPFASVVGRAMNPLGLGENDPPATAADKDAEIAALKNQLADIQSKLDKLDA